MEEEGTRDERSPQGAQQDADGLVVHASRSKVLTRAIPLATVGVLCLVGLVAALLARWSPGFAVLFGVAAVICLGYAALLCVRGISTRPALVVGDESIQDNWYPRDPIPWERVERIERVRALFGTRSIRIVLRNGLSVRVGLGLLDAPAEQLVASIERKHAAWLARHRES